jgi:RNA polymerase sigma factor for flagellar operon FliA
VKRGGLDLVLVPPRVEASLWRRLRYERETRCREQIFTRYRGLARSLARREVNGRLRVGIAVDDLEQFAYEGLLAAIDRYDPLRGVSFGTYARRRIIGSMADGVSRMTEVGAQMGFRRRAERERAASLAIESGAPNALRALADIATCLAIGLMLDGTSLIEPVDGVDPRPTAYESLAWRELHAQLAHGIAGLPEREAMIVRQHYENGVSFGHIAQLLGISKSRVSQLHASAIARLRARIGKSR